MKPFVGVIKFVLIIVGGFAVTVGLWLLMHTMISSDGKSASQIEDGGRIEFVRLKRTEPPKFKEREKPQKPPPPKEPPPPPQMDIADMEKPQQEPLDMDIPNIDMPLAGAGGTGPYLGNYQGGSSNQSRERIPKFRVEPLYPRKARLEGIEGFVRMLIDIDEKGNVVKASITEAEPRRMFESSALRAVYKWKYAPEIIDGVAQTVEGVTVELTFTMGEQ